MYTDNKKSYTILPEHMLPEEGILKLMGHSCKIESTIGLGKKDFHIFSHFYWRISHNRCSTAKKWIRIPIVEEEKEKLNQAEFQ